MRAASATLSHEETQMRIRIRPTLPACYRAQVKKRGRKSSRRRVHSMGARKKLDCFQLGERLGKMQDSIHTGLRFLREDKKGDSLIYAARALDHLRDALSNFAPTEGKEAEKALTRLVRAPMRGASSSHISSVLNDVRFLVGMVRARAAKACQTQRTGRKA